MDIYEVKYFGCQQRYKAQVNLCMKIHLFYRIVGKNRFMRVFKV